MVVTDIVDNKQKICFGKDMVQDITDESSIMPVEVTPEILKILKLKNKKKINPTAYVLRSEKLW